MKRIKQLGLALIHPLFIQVLGLCAVAALVWFAGPLIAIAGRGPLASPTWRVAVIAVMVLVFVLVHVRKLWLANRRNQQIVDEMTAQGDSGSDPDAEINGARAQSAEEIAVLSERFNDALNTLRKARFGGPRRRSYLYQLPWYILIGPPGSGKTTALKNSGLRFPLSPSMGAWGQQAIGGVGGTRNCDWWFTESAVLLDTAGRYTTQDSHHEVDSAAWFGFLDLLKKYRRRRPINGAIVAVGIGELLRMDEVERRTHARAVRRRLNELHSTLR